MKIQIGQMLRTSSAVLLVMLGLGVMEAAAQTNGASAASKAMQAKLARIVFPVIQFHEVNFQDLVQYLGDESRRLDPKGEGVNFVIQSSKAQTVTTSLRNVPLDQAVPYLATLAGLDCRFDEQAVVFYPRGSDLLKTFDLVHDLPPPNPAMQERLARIVFPEIKFREADFQDVIAYIGEESRKLDPKKEGINVVLQVSPDCPINLSLRNISAAELLKYVAASCKLRLRINAEFVAIY